jgi:hypothetical protein
MRRSGGTEAGPVWNEPSSHRRGTRATFAAVAMAGACASATFAFLAQGELLTGSAFAAAAAALLVVWGPSLKRPPPLPRLATQLVARAQKGDPDIYLDLDAVEVEAVYLLGSELFAHLKGGVGQRVDPGTGHRRPIQTSDVSLTWRCSGRKMAEKLAGQLNDWESRATPLRLLAARGRCALLMEDDSRWVTLPELKLAA